MIINTTEELPGAQLKLEKIDGNSNTLVEAWVSTNEAHVIENLKPGKYYISETKAPNGFILSTEVMEIEITQDGGTVIATFYNTPEIEVPNTLSNKSILTIVVGIITITIGGSIVYINYRKEEM